jgi:Flp pilus assembly protein TadG
VDIHASRSDEALTKMRRRQRGGTLLEFTLVGIPLIFLLISTVEIARGMWIYETLAHSVRQGTRFTIVKGQNCATSPNSCSVTIARIAQEMQSAGIGLDPAAFTNVTFTAHAGRTITHTTLQDCLSDTTSWPTTLGVTDSGAATGADLEIAVTYRFRTAIAMFWPGTGKASGSRGTFYFPASSRESIQF